MPITDSTRAGFVLAAFFAAAAVQSAYLPLWFADHGLSAAEIGFVLGIGALLRIAAVPAGGWAADRLGRRHVLAGAAVVAALAAAALPAARGLGATLAATVCLGVAGALLSPLMDAWTLALAAARRLDYGRTRAWGSVAYMLTTAGAGALLARAGTTVVPALLATGFALAALGTAWLPEAGSRGASAGAGPGPFQDRGFRLALVATALIQGSHAAYYGFAPLHWRAIGLGDAAIGLLIAEGIVAEIALFLWGQRFVAWLGPARLTAIAASACILRWTALAFVTGWPALAALQLLHAATFAMQHLSAMAVLRRLPAGRAGVAQTVLAALGFSGPTGALVWLTGRLYGGFGGLAFLPMAVVGGAALFTVRPLARVLRAPAAATPRQ